MLGTSPKDPDEIIDYKINWAPSLQSGDTIQSVQYSVPTGITNVESKVSGDDATTIRLSGGMTGSRYVIRSTITTVGQEKLKESFIIVVRER